MKITLTNRLVLLLAARKIRMATDFARLLKEHGYEISSSQASRYLKDDMPNLSREFIEAVCNALKCMPSDMFEIKVTYEPGELVDDELQLPRHAVVAGGSNVPSDVPVAARAVPSTPTATVLSPDKAKTGWSGKHPASGPKMAPMPVIDTKK